MSVVDINGIKVHFPFEPYDIQKRYMEKVIECMENSTNAVLESPTGTGKTLSLLCASLAWLKDQNTKGGGAFKEEKFELSPVKSNDMDSLLQEINEKFNVKPWIPKIIYASRTHSQLSQAMQELKRTFYSDVKASVLGSREQMCINKEVQAEPNNNNKVNMCRMLVKSRQCSMHQSVEGELEKVTHSSNILDIEDLVAMGRKRHFCPYYMAREISKAADIYFMPYNYILDPNQKRMHGIDLNNSVIILDEAHNVEKMCEESASMDFDSTNIAMCLEELTFIMENMEKEENEGPFQTNDQSKDFTIYDLVKLKELFLEFEKVVDAIPLGQDGATFEGTYLLELFEKTGINNANKIEIIGTLEKLVQYLSTTSSDIYGRKGQHLSIIRNLLVLIYSNDTPMLREKIKKCFKVNVRVQDTFNKGGAPRKNTGWLSKATAAAPKTARVIGYWCFSPGFGMEMLIKQGVRSVILTSGTLAPLTPLVSELGVDIPVRLENPHIITEDQILVKIIGNGYNNIQLDSSYKNRENYDYIYSLGKTIQNFVNIIPDGLLIFFPSYPIMNKCKETWQQCGIWTHICRIKPIFVEPRTKFEFINVMNEYYETIKRPGSRGACFMAVCRGKVAEGLDFIDENGRGVIITGLPFPPLKEPKIVLKRQYLDVNRTKENELLTGSNWYTLEAIRAVNQAIGRVIRHRNDYGVVLLCDYRFNDPRLRTQLSSWVRTHIKVTKNFGESIQGLSQFFKNAKLKYPTKRSQEAMLFDPSEDKCPIESGPAFQLLGTSKSGSSTQSERGSTVTSTPDSDILSIYKNTSKESNIKKSTGKSESIDFNRLDNSKSVIDFNVIDKTSSVSANHVTVHQRPRKRKLNCKMIDLTASSSNESKQMNDSDKKQKMSVCIDLTDEDSSDLTPINDDSLKHPKKSCEDFLLMVKTSMTNEEYKKFVLIISEYKKNKMSKSFVSDLHSILDKKDIAEKCILGVDSSQANDGLERSGAYHRAHSLAAVVNPPQVAVHHEWGAASITPGPPLHVTPSSVQEQQGIPGSPQVVGAAAMSGGPHSHGRPPAVAPGPPAWNHLQVPSFYAGRQPQHAHMSSEHHLLPPRPPTWHTPSTDPAGPLFSLQQMLGAERSAGLPYGLPPVTTVDLSLPTRSTHSPRNGSNQNGESSSPISLSVRDAKQINSLAERRQSIQEVIPPKRQKRVDSILERLNTGSGSVIVSAAHSSHDESSNGSQPGVITSSPLTRDDDAVSPASNEDSLDGSKSRRKRKPNKTVRLSKDGKPSDDDTSQPSSIPENLLNLTKSDSNTSIDLSKTAMEHDRKTPPQNVAAKPPMVANVSVVQHVPVVLPTEHPVIVKRRSSSEGAVPQSTPVSPSKTRRKTFSESETIDNIAAMIASTETDQKLLENSIDSSTKAPSPERNIPTVNLVSVLSSPTQADNVKIHESREPTPVSASNVIVANNSKVETQVVTPKTPPPDSIIQNTVAEPENVLKVEDDCDEKVSVEAATPTKANVKSDSTSFVEVENQLEQMFAGLEENADAMEAEASTSIEREKVTSTSSEINASPKKTKKARQSRSKTSSRRSSDCNSNESTPRKKHKGGKKDVDDSPSKRLMAASKTLAKGGKNKKGAAIMLDKQKQKPKHDTSLQKDVYSYDSGSNTSSIRSRGPFIQIRGPRESPISVSVINTPCADDDAEKAAKKVVKKSFHDDTEYRHKVRSKGLHSSTLSMKYDAHTTDTSWICVFCKRGPHTSVSHIQVANLTNLSSNAPLIGYSSGDLFGPYVISSDCPEYQESLEILQEVKNKKFLSEPGTSGVQGKYMSKKAKKRHLQTGVDAAGIHEAPLEPHKGAALEGMADVGQNKFEVWAHEDCIVWGPGVYLAGPRIVGLEGAVWGACSVHCEHCGRRGASVSCLMRGCDSHAHFCCAKQAGWSLDEETYKAHCQRHKKV